MTEVTPNYRNPDNLQPGKRSTLAIVSLILGIIALIPCAGVPFALAAIICAIIALVKLAAPAQFLTGKGFAITGLITGIFGLIISPILGLVVFPVFAAVLIPSLGHARELANRSTCAANTRGIVQSMIVYAQENNGAYPTVSPPAVASSYALAVGSATKADSMEALKTYYSAGSSSNAAGSVPANLWILVLSNQTTPKQFLCKSDPVPTTMALVQTGGATGNFNTNFNGATPDFTYSYSIIYPWTSEGTVGAWWRDTTDSSLPVMSDMAPLNGTGSRPVCQTAGSGRGGIPANGIKAWNSMNHLRDGQNVGFADAHAEFALRPDVGQNNDNIFTVWNGGNSLDPGSAVTTPGSVGTGMGQSKVAPFDTIMVPMADCDTGRRQ